MKEKLVCVEWEDASYNSGYYDKKSPEDFKPVFSKSVGHLIKLSKQTVLLSMDRFYSPDKKKMESERHITIIPKKMITKIIYLEAQDATQKREK